MTTANFRDSEWSHPQWDPYPEAWLESRLWPIQERLERIRERWQGPIFVSPNGGYRSPRHNAAVGGAEESLHMEGLATDCRIRRLVDVWRFRALVMRMWKAGELEGLSGVGVYRWGVHLDFFAKTRPDGSPRRWFTIRRQRP